MSISDRSTRGRNVLIECPQIRLGDPSIVLDRPIDDGLKSRSSFAVDSETIDYEVVQFSEVLLVSG